MEKFEKVLLFSGIVGVIFFTVGMIISVNEGGWTEYGCWISEESPYQDFSVISAGNILSFLGAEIFFVTILIISFYYSRFLWKTGSSKKIDTFYLLFAPALFSGISVSGIIFLILDFKFLHGEELVIPVYSEIVDLLGIASSTFFWIIFAIVEIVMLAIFFFRGKKEEVKNEL